MLSRNPGGNESYIEIFMYLDVVNMLKKLIDAFYSLTGITIEERAVKPYKLISFTSVEGGSGCTSVSLATAEILNKIYGLSCIYVNIKPFDDSFTYLENEDGISRSSLILRLNSGKDFPIGGHIKSRSTFDYLSSQIFCNFAYDFNEVLIRNLIEKISALGKYDIIIMDFGNFVIRENIKLLSDSDVWILMRRSDLSKLNSFCMQAENRLIKEVMNDNLIICVNRDRASKNDSLDAEEDVHRIPWQPESFIRMGGRVKLNLNGAYGLECAALSNKIWGLCNES